MIFTSIPFLLLFTITYGLIWGIRDHNKRLVILLISSYVFYAYWDVRFLFLMIAEEYLCYFLAKEIAKCDKQRTKKIYMVTGVLISLTVLGFFKYFNFFRESIYEMLHIGKYSPLNIILPIGISFYVFQALSYLIDVYRGDVKAQDSFLKVSLYISFFPQLVAGPIVRAADFLPQLDKNPDLTKDNFLCGLQIFTLGVFKKLVVADRLAVCVDSVFAAPAAYSGGSILCAIISYSIQIYCDFSGYSDMAIGIAKVFGYELCPNFDLPYLSLNPTEFWKRWHISLSMWLKNYLYIPLGGNRHGELRRNINLFLTMLLGGLWHGASWNFVIWGGLHGIALIIHKHFRKIIQKYKISIKNKAVKWVSKVSAVLLNNVFVMTCWVFFRAQTLQDAKMIFARVLRWNTGIEYIYTYTIIFGILIGITHILGKLRKNTGGAYLLLDLSKFSESVLFFVIWWIIIGFAYIGDAAFIYFQF